jgi:RimJ/RimL family protein N-acetyltransferase
MPSIPFLELPLAERGVILRDASERDIPEILIAHQDDPELYARIGMQRPPSGAELGREAEREQSERATGASARLTITEHSSDELRGRVIVHEVDWPNQRAELGVWVVPPARDRGLASAALRLASRWLFESCGLQRVDLVTDPDNEPMRAAARGAGFVEEGTLRGYNLSDGGRRDMISMSLLPADLQQHPGR